jgi:hypothetical protein
VAVVAIDLWSVWTVRTFHILLVVIFTIHVGAPLHAPKRHLFCLPAMIGPNLFGGTSSGGVIRHAI